MHDDFGSWTDRLHGRIAPVDELREAGHVGRGPAFRPEHTVVGFVAHLHPFGRYTIEFQSIQYGVGMVVHIGQELAEAMVGPSGGLGLLAGVGPGVTVVKVNHDAKA